MPKGSPDLAAARREEILAACAKLYETKPFRDITIRDIGDATTFGRTSIYNYFQTREEIFLGLLQQEYGVWSRELKALAADAPAHSPAALADGLAETLSRRGLLLKLLTVNLSEMEENCRDERLADFKRTYSAALAAVEACLQTFCPAMDAAARKRFLYAFFPFLYGVHPYTTVSDKQRRAMRAAGFSYEPPTAYSLIRALLRQLLGIAEAAGAGHQNETP